MSDPNDLIVGRIKKARVERGKTQQDLARHLKRTPAAISDLERGKVQVSAADLYRISRLLNQPIEYFYGEEYGDQTVRDLLAILRNESPESQEQIVGLISMFLRMQEAVEGMQTAPPDAEIQVEQIKKFFELFIPFSIGINKMTEQLNELRDLLTHELEIKGIDVSQLLPKNQETEPASQASSQLEAKRRKKK